MGTRQCSDGQGVHETGEARGLLFFLAPKSVVCGGMALTSPGVFRRAEVHYSVPPNPTRSEYTLVTLHLLGDPGQAV